MLALSQDIIDKIITDFNKPICELAKMRLLNKKYNNIIKPFFEHINNKTYRSNYEFNLLDKDVDANILWLIEKYEHKSIYRSKLLKNFTPPLIVDDIVDIMLTYNEINEFEKFISLNKFDISNYLNRTDICNECFCNDFDKFMKLTKLYHADVYKNRQHIFEQALSCGNFKLFEYMLATYKDIKFGKQERNVEELCSIMYGENLNILKYWKNLQLFNDFNDYLLIDSVIVIMLIKTGCGSINFFDELLLIADDKKEVCRDLIKKNFKCYDNKIMQSVFENIGNDYINNHGFNIFEEYCKFLNFDSNDDEEFTILKLYNTANMKEVLHNNIIFDDFMQILVCNPIDKRIYEWVFNTFKNKILNDDQIYIFKMNYNILFGTNYGDKNIVIDLSKTFDKSKCDNVLSYLIEKCNDIDYIKWFYDFFEDNLSDKNIVDALINIDNLVDCNEYIKNTNIINFLADIIIKRHIKLSDDDITYLETYLINNNMNIFRKKLFNKLGFNDDLSSDNLITMFMQNNYDINILDYLYKFNSNQKISVIKISVKLNKSDIFIETIKHLKLNKLRKIRILHYCAIFGTDELFIYMKSKFVNDPVQIYNMSSVITNFNKHIDGDKLRYDAILLNKLSKGNIYCHNFIKKMEKLKNINI